MITFHELNEQNHKITELSNILIYLINDRAMCDNDITCDLFFNYITRVQDHLDMEERELYKPLLTYTDPATKNTANMFLAGSSEIKRVFNQYINRWCRKHELHVKDYDVFVKETRDMFNLVLKRIEDETEHLYPLVRKVAGDRFAA